jgi:phage-related minor tail protein
VAIVANRVILPPKRVGETVLYPQFDFLSFFSSATDSISSILSVTASVYSGIDANPSAIISTSSLLASVVSVLITAGVLGVIYEVAVKVQLASGQQPILCGYLAITQDLP